MSAPDTLYRIGQRREPLYFSGIRPDDAALRRAGNRYSIPGGKVLYAASNVRACFGETLARFRPSPRIRALLAEEPEGDFMVCGGVPQDWRLQRTITSLSLDDPLPFVDVDDASTHEALSTELASQLLALGYDENLDLSDVRNRDRRLSRAISEWAYTELDVQGDFAYSGIRYVSRVCQEWECWAIFDGTTARETERKSIELTDPDLVAVADMWGLRPF